MNQEAISKADLRVYEALVDARIEKNQGQPVWQQLNARWAVIVRHAQETVEQSRKGMAMPSYKRMAAVELVKLSNAVEPEAIIRTVLALYLLQDAEPRKIKSQRAFLAQMVRRVRGLTSLNAGTWTDTATGKTKVAYRELSPRAVGIIGRLLVEPFGPTGITIAKLEQKDHQRKQRELIEHNQALGELR